VLKIVPGDKPLAVSSGVLDAAEITRKVVSILQGFKLSLGVWIVIAVPPFLKSLLIRDRNELPAVFC